MMKAKIFILIALLFGLSSAYCQIDLSKEYAQEKEEVKEALKEIEQSIRNNETDKSEKGKILKSTYMIVT